MSDALYFELLGDPDLELLAATGDERDVTALRARPGRVEALLGDPAVFAALFGDDGRDALLVASPFLAFSVLVARTAADLAQERFVSEWVGVGERVPVFDVASLRAFLDDAGRRLFLAELLASYVRVASGSVYVRTERGWRRRPYSELDPLRLAELVEVLPWREHAAVYRRLGDLALFLSGVFPDHAAAHALEPRELARLRRLMRAGDRPTASDAVVGGAAGGIAALEWVGRRAYELAQRGATSTGPASVLAAVGERFAEARRILNHVTDRHLFPLRRRWFGAA